MSIKNFFETSLNLFKVFIKNHSKTNLVELTSALNSIEEKIIIYMYFTSHLKDDLDQEELNIFIRGKLLWEFEKTKNENWGNKRYNLHKTNIKIFQNN